MPIIDEYSLKFNLKKIFPISALKQDGLEELKKCLIKNLPEGLPFYPEDMITDFPERFFVSELIREKIFQSQAHFVPLGI